MCIGCALCYEWCGLPQLLLLACHGEGSHARLGGGRHGVSARHRLGRCLLLPHLLLPLSAVPGSSRRCTLSAGSRPACQSSASVPLIARHHRTSSHHRSVREGEKIERRPGLAQKKGSMMSHAAARHCSPTARSGATKSSCFTARGLHCPHSLAQEPQEEPLPLHGRSLWCSGKSQGVASRPPQSAPGYLLPIRLGASVLNRKPEARLPDRCPTLYLLAGSTDGGSHRALHLLSQRMYV